MAVKKNQKPSKDNVIQNHFINKFKEVLRPGVGLAEELAAVLDVSIDSAYRRIRGETEITIEEIYKITKQYAISVDELFSNQNNAVTFGYTKLTDSGENFEAYISRLKDQIVMINKFDKKKIYYIAEEIPIFYSFFSKKLTEFKLFYWQRSVLNVAEFQQKKFAWGIVSEKLIDIAHQSFKEYMSVPSVEIWTSETVLTNLKQILFYFEAGIISKQCAEELLLENKKMIEMIQTNAENARKNISDKEETFLLYCSEIVLGTNCIYTLMGDAKYSHISFNTLNSLTTNNPEFCEETEHWMRNLEQKSTLISGVGQKERYQFFSKMFKVIDGAIEKVRAN